MTLKADRQIDAVELGYFTNSLVTGGEVLSIATAGSGIAMEDVLNVVEAKADSSGAKPVGLCLQEVVSLDLTRVPVNWHKDQAVTGDKVTLLRRGWVTTNTITGEVAGLDKAVLSSSGYVAAKAAVGSHNEVANPTVGTFLTGKDETGYARLEINL